MSAVEIQDENIANKTIFRTEAKVSLSKSFQVCGKCTISPEEKENAQEGCNKDVQHRCFMGDQRTTRLSMIRGRQR